VPSSQEQCGITEVAEISEQIMTAADHDTPGPAPMSEKSRPIAVSLSGGRDSGAVGVWLAQKYAAGELDVAPRYVCADVGPLMEPDLLPWLQQYEAKVLAPHGLRVEIVEATRADTEPGWASVFERPNRQPILPGPLSRSCTERLKLRPMRAWRKANFGPTPWHLRRKKGEESKRIVHKDCTTEVLWVIGYRSDEGNANRTVGGEWSVDAETGDPLWRPFIALKYGVPQVRQILADAGVPEPAMYEWTTRSGCVFCFFKPRRDIAAAAERFPELFEHHAEHEARVIAKAKANRGASPYVITKGGTLRELVAAERQLLPLFDLDAWDERSCGDALRTCEL
jgi:hypothetical protein